MIQYKKASDEFNIQIQENLEKLEEIKALYNKKIELYSKCLSNMNYLLDNYAIHDEEYISSLFNKTQESFYDLLNQIKNIDTNKEKLNDIKIKFDTHIDCNEDINKYNEEFKTIKNNYFNNSIYEENIMLNYIETQINCLKNNDNGNQENNKKDDDINTAKDNGTLLISEIQNKVILPYTAKEVEEIFEKYQSKYETIEDVIQDNFVRPLSDYKDLHFARARETYKLLTQRENYSKLEATDIVLELFGKRYLHPAIISACKCLDELDVYLDCLDKNELDDFRIFKIKYEIYPTLVKENKLSISKINIIQRIIDFFKRNFSKKEAKRVKCS